MLNKLIHWSLHNRAIVVGLALILMVLGAKTTMELPVEVVKKIVSEKPIASIAVLSSIGLLIARKPEVALRLFDKVVGGLGSGLGGKE